MSQRYTLKATVIKKLYAVKAIKVIADSELEAQKLVQQQLQLEAETNEIKFTETPPVVYFSEVDISEEFLLK